MRLCHQCELLNMRLAGEPTRLGANEGSRGGSFMVYSPRDTIPRNKDDFPRVRF